MQDGVFLMYIFGGCSDSVTVDGGVHAVKGVKMEIGVAVSQGKNTRTCTNVDVDMRANNDKRFMINEITACIPVLM
jgi:hypothetical protein